MSNNQSSVEWLVNVVQSCIAPDYIPIEIVKQAKEMHKEEIIHSYRCGAAEVGMIAVNKPKQYYKETFA